MRARHAKAQLKGERWIVAQSLGYLDEVLAPDVDGHLAVRDDDPLDGVADAAARRLERAAERVGDLVEIRPVGPLGGEHGLPPDLQAAVTRGVTARLGAERAGAHHLLTQALAPRDLCSIGLRRVRLSVARLLPRRPGHWSASGRGAALCSDGSSGSLRSPACSSSVICFSLLTPSFMFWILSCSFTIESISISGRGGQPGR